MALPGSRRLVVFATVAAALAAVACLDDRPVSSGSTIQLAIEPSVARSLSAAIATNLPGITGTPEILVRAYTYGQSENIIELFRGKVPIDTATRRHLLTIDLLPCLQQSARVTSGPVSGCSLYIEFRLQVDTLIIDDQSSYVTARPGQLLYLPVTLTVGTTPPVLSVDSAVLVDSALLRYVVSGADPDGNFKEFSGYYSDSIGAFASYRSVFFTFPDVVGNFSGPLYQVLEPPVSGQLTRRLYLNGYDSKGAPAVANFGYDSLDVASPNIQVSPVASNVNPTISLQGIRVAFSIADVSSNASRVDVLFHSIPDSLNNYLDTLFTVCSAPITSGTGPKSVDCPPLLLPRRVEVFVVPFSPAGPGVAGSTTAIVP